jgi:hypothetical protein
VSTGATIQGRVQHVDDDLHAVAAAPTVTHRRPHQTRLSSARLPSPGQVSGPPPRRRGGHRPRAARLSSAARHSAAHVAGRWRCRHGRCGPAAPGGEDTVRTVGNGRRRVQRTAPCFPRLISGSRPAAIADTDTVRVAAASAREHRRVERLSSPFCRPDTAVRRRAPERTCIYTNRYPPTRTLRTFVSVPAITDMSIKYTALSTR